MSNTPIRFEDGAAYEQAMGVWSQIAGRAFLDWLAPAPGLRWIDVGCGNGAFTELILEHAAPSEVHGVDPSEGQISYAATRAAAGAAHFRTGEAQHLPFPDARFDVAVMALVIFFVPEPAEGVAEMRRVVHEGGSVAAYAWDITGGGFPFEPLQAELRARGYTPSMPPRLEASRTEELYRLWTEAGLDAIEQRAFTVERHFTDFADFWAASTAISAMKAAFAAMPEADLRSIQDGVRSRITTHADGSVSLTARANAIKGRRR